MISFIKNKLFSWFALVSIGLFLLWVSFLHQGIWIVAATFFIGLSIITTTHKNNPKALTMLLGITSAIAAIDYFTWRFLVTNWHDWWLSTPLLAAELLGGLHILGQQYTLWPQEKQISHERKRSTHLPIYILIPTVNEPLEILEATIKGAQAAKNTYLKKYPNGKVTIVICKDGMKDIDLWQNTKALADQIGVTMITRTQIGGAKAGNLEHAREYLHIPDDSLIAIFDADQIAKEEFLTKTVPYFNDETLGWVQTGQYYHNLENPVAAWADDQQSLFYNMLCPGKATSNAVYICGTNVIIRSQALSEIGGFPQEFVTEDFAASIKMHATWKSIFIPDVLATGLGPVDISSYLKQQRRWATGTLSVLKSNWKLILLPSKNGLTLEQRIHYFLASTHYLCGIRDFIYLVTPLIFLITGIPAVRATTLSAFLWHFVPYFLITSAAFWYAGWGITGLKGIIIGFGSFPVLIESFVTALIGRKIGFHITPKQKDSVYAWNYFIMYFLFLLLSISCIGLSMKFTFHNTESQYISFLWIIYSLFMLSGFFFLILKDVKFHILQNKKQETQKDNSIILKKKYNFIPKWAVPSGIYLLLLLVIPTTLFTVRAHVSAFTGLPLSAASVIRHDKTPLLGISLPTKDLYNKQTFLEEKLSTHFTLIGRTQDLQDNFDKKWANKIGMENARPWITLEFGQFDAQGKPPLTASLPAIANGVQDENIKRWADEIRAYEKPVYLTIFLHTDKDWSLSSAVANGGIPQDVPRAWNHVQSIFATEKVTNVVWVWAPADPANDKQFAPSEESIDIVLLSLIRYPHTKWVNPQTAVCTKCHKSSSNETYYFRSERFWHTKRKSRMANQCWHHCYKNAKNICLYLP